MAVMRTMSLTTIMLVLSSGLILPVDAQQTYRDSPTYSPLPQEPPPLYGSPQQPSSPGGGIQLYSQPGSGDSASRTSPRTAPYPDPGRFSSEADWQENRVPSGWRPLSNQIQEHQGVRYISGGVGESERAELNALSGQFNLRLLFAMQGEGDYLADVRVHIMDAHSKSILEVESQGPWFFAQLPPGAYRIEVSALHQTQRRTVQVRDSRQSRLDFYWR
ncbi:MAG: carboxypeptidase regulatory-like domain-containing protein [Gammaproteobacteria bacterium]|nr:carboxypeptidase regulatory-like domain-containing protein [Gammaproteobacteria bacterium]MCP5196439.1 carboxypeptidase regulatory-like domain-containing protein [Gammaproteobacteria bacterium]